MRLLIALLLPIVAIMAAQREISGEEALLEQSPTLRNLYEQMGIDIHAPRVVGGNLASANQYPFVVTLWISSGLFSVICGGSIFRPDIVLTAAHCVDGRVSATISAGTTKRTESDITRQERFSSTFRIHSGWNSGTFLNDIAIVKLSSPFDIGGAVQTIAIPSSDSNNYAGSTGTVIGWGSTEINPTEIVEDLRYASDTVLSLSQCQNYWGSTVRDTMICLNASNRRGSCTGDSGGPLVVGNTLVGIVSFSSSAGCLGGYPSVYTRTSDYISWIQQYSY